MRILKFSRDPPRAIFHKIVLRFWVNSRVVLIELEGSGDVTEIGAACARRFAFGVRVRSARAPWMQLREFWLWSGAFALVYQCGPKNLARIALSSSRSRKMSDFK